MSQAGRRAAQSS